MNPVTITIPLLPSSDFTNNFSLENKFNTSSIKQNFPSNFSRDSKSNIEINSTKLQLTLLNNISENNFFYFYQIKYLFSIDTILHFTPVINTNYLSLFYLSSKSHFKEISNTKTINHEKGNWIITSLSNSSEGHKLLFPKASEIGGIGFFIPIDGLKSISDLPSQSYLNQLIHPQKPYLIYESGNIKLKKLFELIRMNNMETLLEVVDFHANIYALLKVFIENIQQGNSKFSNNNLKKNDTYALEKVEKILLENLKNPPTIQMLSSEAAMSPTKFKTIFKKMYGESVHQYYLKHRMELAQQWLSEKKLTIGEISQKLGYKNLSHFSRNVKDYFVEVPSKYSHK